MRCVSDDFAQGGAVEFFRALSVGAYGALVAAVEAGDRLAKAS